MRYTKEQYEKAIEHLTAAMTQLEPDSYCCRICGDNGHASFECGSNPLVAVAICLAIASKADELHEKMHNWDPSMASLDDELHEFLHHLAGYDIYMGVQVGPAAIRDLEPPCSTF